MVNFHFNPELTVVEQAALMGVIILLVNARSYISSFFFKSCFVWVFLSSEYVFLNSLVTQVTTEDGLSFPDLHHHKLFFDDSIAGHWCDLCRAVIKPHGAVY